MKLKEKLESSLDDIIKKEKKQKPQKGVAAKSKPITKGQAGNPRAQKLKQFNKKQQERTGSQVPAQRSANRPASQKPRPGQPPKNPSKNRPPQKKYSAPKKASKKFPKKQR